MPSYEAGHMRRRRDREARRKAFAPPRAGQKLRKHFAARREEPAVAVTPVEWRDHDESNRGNALPPQSHPAFDKGHAQVMCETTIKENLLDSPAREQSRLRRDRIPACVLGRAAKRTRSTP